MGLRRRAGCTAAMRNFLGVSPGLAACGVTAGFHAFSRVLNGFGRGSFPNVAEPQVDGLRL